MELPPYPLNERERLAALDASGLLDTIPDDELDRLVKEAAQICGTPIAAVSLVSRHRQWFKASVGLGTDETPRDISFCAHSFAEPAKLMEVTDAAHDARFFDNPLVTGSMGLRFYAGVPLVTDEGHALGALCVIDTQPRRLSDEQRQSLRALGRQVMTQIKRRQLASSRPPNDAPTALSAADEASVARVRLLATMSHELRTPINGILGMATLLRSTRLDPEQQEMAETIRSSSEQLIRLLNQVLDLARMDAEGQVALERQPIDLVESVDEVVDLVEPDAAAKGVRVRTLVDPEVPPRVLADGGRLRQILLNLVSNAVKFTAQGEVLIEVGPGSQEGEWRLSVTDTGPGIPPGRIGKLFQPFFRVEETSHQTPGTGLGLAISRRLVELMGGRIRAENAPGRGARFSFTLPAARVTPPPRRPLAGVRAEIRAHGDTRAALQARLRWWGAAVLADEPTDSAGPPDLLLLDGPAHASPARFTVRLLDSPAEPVEGELTLVRPLRWRRLLHHIEQGLSLGQPALVDLQKQGFDRTLARRLPLKILLAEDNLVNQRVITKMLERFGYEPRVVLDGQQAIDLLRAEPFDLVLMDLYMPVLDGLQATRLLRREGSKAWIVAFTASAFEQDLIDCQQAGMNGVLTKPLLVPALLQALYQAAARQSEGQSID